MKLNSPIQIKLSNAVSFPSENTDFFKRLRQETDRGKPVETEFQKSRNKNYKPHLLSSNSEPTGVQLKKARKSLGLTQSQLSFRTKISQSSVSRYERGAKRKNAAWHDVNVMKNMRKYFENEWHIMFLNDGRIITSQDSIL